MLGVFIAGEALQKFAAAQAKDFAGNPEKFLAEARTHSRIEASLITKEAAAALSLLEGMLKPEGLRVKRRWPDC